MSKYLKVSWVGNNQQIVPIKETSENADNLKSGIVNLDRLPIIVSDTEPTDPKYKIWFKPIS